MKVSRSLLFGLSFVAIQSAFATQRSHEVQFGVLRQFAIGGEGGWDYLSLDAEGSHLFVTRGNHVMVMGTANGKIVADMTGMEGVHGVAIASKLHKGFITSGRQNEVVVFDSQSFKETARIKVGENPDAVLFDPSTNRIFTFNGRSSDTTVVDAATNKVLGTIPLGGKPEFAQADGKGDVFVNIEDKSEVVEFDGKGLKVIRRWSIMPAEEPSGLAFDAKGMRLFSVCSNQKMAVSDAKTGKLITTVKIGDGPDAAAYDPGAGLAFSSNGGTGTVTVVKCGPGNTFTPVQEVTTATSARTMTLDPKRHLIYLIAAKFEAPTAGQRRGRMVPNSAVIIVVGEKK